MGGLEGLVGRSVRSGSMESGELADPGSVKGFPLTTPTLSGWLKF